MKGLLLKEGYQAFAYGRMIFLAAVVMFAVSAVILREGGEQGMFLVYACFLMGIFPMTQLAYDESFGWTAYSYTLPVRREQLVGVKYLTGLVFTAFGAFLSAPLLLGGVTVCGLLYFASWRLSVAWYGKARD